MHRQCRLGLLLASICAAGLLTGCLEATMLIRVNTDGSGTFRVRYLQVAAEGAGTHNPDALVAAAARIGSGVTLSRSRPISRDGRTGFLAEYAFTDVTKLRPEEIESVLRFQGQPLVKPRYRFEFTGGQPATLTVVPLWEPSGAAAIAGLAPVGTDISMITPEQQEQLTAIQEQLGNLLLSFYVQVNGEIIETNATHRQQETPSTVTLHYINMAKRPPALDLSRLLQAADATAVGEVARGAIPGIRLEDPNNRISIRFQ